MAILKIILIVVFLIAALAVTVIVLLQEGKSAGLGSLSGTVSNNDSYWDKNKKYSLEGKFEKWTKITAALFVLSALVLMLISSKGNANTQLVTPNTNTTTESTTEGAASTSDAATESATPEASTDATASPEASESTSAAK